MSERKRQTTYRLVKGGSISRFERTGDDGTGDGAFKRYVRGDVIALDEVEAESLRDRIELAVAVEAVTVDESVDAIPTEPVASDSDDTTIDTTSGTSTSDDQSPPDPFGFNNIPARAASRLAKESDDMDMLAKMYAFEDTNQKRKMVLRAIESRVNQLSGE